MNETGNEPAVGGRPFWILVRASLRRHLASLLLGVVFLVAFEFLITWLLAVSDASQNISVWIKFVPRIFTTLLFEGDIGDVVTVDRLVLMIGFRHPLVTVLFCALTIGIASSGLAGEVENRTCELLLVRPVRRYVVVLHLAFVVILASSLLNAAAYLASRASLAVLPAAGNVSGSNLMWMSFANTVLYASIGMYSLLFSAFASERSRALMVAIGLTLAQYFLAFLAVYSYKLSFLHTFSVFSYIDARTILTTGQPDWPDLGYLAAFSVVCLAVGTWRFSARDV